MTVDSGGPRLATRRGRITVVVSRDASLTSDAVGWLALTAALRDHRSVMLVEPAGGPFNSLARMAADLSTLVWHDDLTSWDALLATLARVAAERMDRALLDGVHAGWDGLPPNGDVVALPGFQDYTLPLRSVVRLRQLAISSGADLIVAGNQPSFCPQLMDVADEVVEVNHRRAILELRKPNRDRRMRLGSGFGGLRRDPPDPTNRGSFRLVRDDDGAVIGYRTWGIAQPDGTDNSHRLQSVFREHVWGRGHTTSACHRCGPTPREEHTCGLYAYASLARACEDWDCQKNPALGMVRGWGRVHVGRWGWRAEHAQVMALVVSSEDDTVARDLSARYDCPVSTCSIPTIEVTPP